MTMLQRFRVWLALLLCRGTKCSVVRDRPLLLLLDTAAQMAQYVQVSGGLTATHSERRIRAYKVLLRGSAAMIAYGRAVLVGPFPKAAPLIPPPTQEETHESKAA